MNSRRAPGIAGDSLQGGDERNALAGVKRGEDLILVLVGDLACAREQLSRGVGQVNGVGPSVAWMPSPFHQTPLFEVVKQADHDFAVDAQRVGELLLGTPLATLHVHEQSEVVRCDAQRCKARGERLRNVEPEL